MDIVEAFRSYDLEELTEEINVLIALRMSENGRLNSFAVRKILGISKSTLKRRIKAGKLPMRKIGKLFYIDTNNFINLIRCSHANNAKSREAQL